MATNYTMWILKGTLLGLWLFGFGTLAFLYIAVYRHMRPNSAVSISVITWYTTQNPIWWIALVVCFVLGYAIVRSWSPPTILWVAVLVTGLIPAGWFALFLTVMAIAKHARQGHL
jgi:hypothetical protein